VTALRHDAWMTADEAAAYLGYRTRTALYQAVRRPRLVPIGSRLTEREFRKTKAPPVSTDEAFGFTGCGGRI
jgi:hypothetical protein